MSSTGHGARSWHQRMVAAGVLPLRWLAGWGRLLLTIASLVVLALAPSSYTRQARAVLVRQLVADTAPIMAGFTALCALLTLVITRIVVVTAFSYGLSRYALEMVIRVLVLELIPLTAALFVALRCTIPNGAELAALRRDGAFAQWQARGEDPLATQVVPRAVAGMYATLTLAALSCVVAALIAYFAVYGASTAGLPAYTRVFGHVFNPSVSLIFVLKTLFFSLAVSFIPMASALADTRAGRSREGAALQALVRMFAVLILLEAASLAGNYY